MLMPNSRRRGTHAQKTSKLARWGNSLGVRIPQEGIQQLRLKAGESVTVQVVGDHLVIRPARQRRKWTEAELLKGVTPDLCGPDLIPDQVGKEII